MIFYFLFFILHFRQRGIADKQYAAMSKMLKKQQRLFKEEKIQVNIYGSVSALVLLYQDVIREIIVLDSVWYFLNGPGCLNITFLIC